MFHPESFRGSPTIPWYEPALNNRSYQGKSHRWQNSLTVMAGFEVRRSACEGHGLFATSGIAEGTLILEYQGEKISKTESARRKAARNNYIFHLDYQYDLDGAALENTARYLNHSCAPNCIVRKRDGRLFIHAARDIAAEEELTFDYGYDLSEYERFPCNCGARVCCGYILGREFWGELPQTWDQSSFRLL